MKKNFRSIIAILFCVVLILTMFTACGDKKTKGNPKNGKTEEAVVDAEFIDRYCGDWNGCVKFTDCTGKYEDWNDEIVAAIARINVDKDGNLTPFIGLFVEDTPFVDLKAKATADKKITLTGKWADADIGEVSLYESGGTLSTTVTVEKEKGNLTLVFNFRRLDDEGWTDEDPCFSTGQIEYCTGKYEDWNDEIVAAIARINVDKDGNLTPFIGLFVEDTPFVDLKAKATADKKITLTGKWADADIGEVSLYESGGTLSTTVTVEKEKGNLTLVFNFRRLDDEGWTDEDPCFSTGQIEYCKGKTFDELAEIIGYSKSDYPESSVVAPAADTTKAADDGKKSSGGSIVGEWTYVFGDYVYKFDKDGKGSYTAGSTVMNFTYTDNGDSVEILYDGNTVASTYKYRIDGDKLFIEDSFGEEVEYKR